MEDQGRDQTLTASGKDTTTLTNSGASGIPSRHTIKLKDSYSMYHTMSMYRNTEQMFFLSETKFFSLILIKLNSIKITRKLGFLF